MNFVWYKETGTSWCNNFTIQLVSNKFSNVSPRGEKVSSVEGSYYNLNSCHVLLRNDQQLYFANQRYNFYLSKIEKKLYLSSPS